jgi:hypothetical protein
MNIVSVKLLYILITVMVLHSIVYHVREILILAHIWDAFGFPCKIGCDKTIMIYLKYMMIKHNVTKKYFYKFFEQDE